MIARLAPAHSDYFGSGAQRCPDVTGKVSTEKLIPYFSANTQIFKGRQGFTILFCLLATLAEMQLLQRNFVVRNIEIACKDKIPLGPRDRWCLAAAAFWWA